MTTSAAEIETIIRVVMERLRAEGAAPLQTKSGRQHPARSVPTDSNSVSDASTLRLNAQLITLEQVNGQLAGVRVIEVPKRAVVTPAVVDELRRFNVSLKRDGAIFANSTDSKSASTILVVAPPAKLTKQLANSSSDAQLVEGVDLEANLQAIMAHVGTVDAEMADVGMEGNRVIWCSSRPFAAAFATRNEPRLRSVQLANTSDLPLAIAQVQPNVLIIDQRHWSAASIAHLSRTWKVQG